MKRETYAEIIKRVRVLFSTESAIDENQSMLFANFYFSYRHPDTGLSLMLEKYFRAERFDENEKIQLTEEIFNFCLSHNIPLINTIGYFTELYIFESQIASSFVTKNYSDAMSLRTPKITDEQYMAYFEPIMEGFISSLEEYLISFHKDNEFYDQIIVNTYNVAIDNIEHSDNMDMPLNNYKISSSLNFDTNEILKNEKSILEGFMQNKKKFIHMFSKNHFLHHLQNDTLELTEDGKIIFGNHSKALTIAYRNQKALLSIRKNYKDVALRELQTKLRHLEDYDTPESKKLIFFTKNLIAFIQQRKNARIVPVIILAKELGLPKAVALKYAKQILDGTINDASFKKNFDLIERIN